ncbi:MAG: Rieske (2Fe-2S) protein [candidate division Zixibacteria bacterium]|nr:Rieske (2Fe-2S) protein [candidate division Zixibacteria bacterium]
MSLGHQIDDEFDHQAEVETDFMRRGFVKWFIRGVTAVYGAAFVVPVYRFLRSGGADEGGVQVTQITLNDALKLETGAFQMFRFGSKPAIIIRQGENDFKAYLATCTHLGCTVSFNTGSQRISCACHGGQYDPSTGKNVAGPPPAPLTALKTEVANGELIIKV